MNNNFSIDGVEANKRFPYLVIRWMAAAYGRKQIIFVVGTPRVEFFDRVLLVQHPRPFDEKGEITADCRASLLNGVLESVKISRFRMCVVWGHSSCTYVEIDGEFKESSQTPSGGLVLAGLKVSDS